MPQTGETREKERKKKELADLQRPANKLKERLGDLYRFDVSEKKRLEIDKMRLEYAKENREVAEKYMRIEIEILERVDEEPKEEQKDE